MDKELEIKPASSKLPDALLSATAALIENLTQSEPFVHYQEADRKMSADQKAIHLIEEFTELQQKVRTRQYSGSVSGDDIKRLRKLQNEVSTNTVIQNQGFAEEIAVSFLKEVNQEISNLIGIDFASLVRRSGGGC